jgi:hypothetical protein
MSFYLLPISRGLFFHAFLMRCTEFREQTAEAIGEAVCAAATRDRHSTYQIILIHYLSPAFFGFIDHEDFREHRDKSSTILCLWSIFDLGSPRDISICRRINHMRAFKLMIWDPQMCPGSVNRVNNPCEWLLLSKLPFSELGCAAFREGRDTKKKFHRPVLCLWR